MIFLRMENSVNGKVRHDKSAFEYLYHRLSYWNVALPIGSVSISAN